MESLEGRRLLSTVTEIQQIGAAAQFLSGTSSYSLPVNTAVGAGHSLLIEFVSDTTSGTVSASDSAGNTYTTDADISSTSTSLRTVIFSSHGVLPIAAGGSITVSYSGAVVAEGIAAEEFAGLTSSGTLDKTHTKANTTTSTAPTSGNTTTTAQAAELLIGALGVRSSPSVTFTPGANYTGLSSAGTSDVSGANVTINPEYEIVSATGAYAAKGTLSTASYYAAAIATYKADATTHFSVAAPASATAGTPFNVTVTAQNASNATDTGYTGTVHFTSTDGLAGLPSDYTFTSAEAGVHTFSVTLKTAGNQTVSATDTLDGSISGTSGTVAVAAAAATHYTVNAPASATAGTAFSVTVTAQDQYGNTATAYSGTAHFTSSDGQAVLPANSTLTSGVGTFNVTLKTSGNQTVTATDAVTGSITGTSGTITVATAAATHYTVSAPASATAGTAFSITVTAQDQYGNTATAYSGTVHFTSSDGQAVLPANSTLSSGVGTFNVTLKTSGNQTVTATDTVTGSITGTSRTVNVAPLAATHYTVSAPASATAGTAFSITVTAQDQYGNTATAYSGTVHLTSSDGQAVLASNSTLTNGIGTFNVTLKTSGNQTVTATDTVTGSITGTSGTIAVAAAAATHYTVSAPASATAGTAFSITVTAQDQYGNTATAYSGTVHFTSSDSQAVLPANSTLTSGVGTFNMTLKTSGNQTVTATDTVTGSITGTSGTIAAAPAPATHYIISAPASATAGTALSITVTAQDQYGNTATGYSGTVHFTSSDSQAVLPADSMLINGVGTFSVTLKTSGIQSITATDTVKGSITGTATVSVAASVASYLRMAAPATATSGILFDVTVTAQDQFGNIANTYAGTAHFNSSDSAAQLPADSGLVNGVGNFQVTLEAIGSDTLTASDTGNTIPPSTAAISVAIGSVPITGFEFTPLRQVRVAHFGYNDDSLPTSAFQVTIDWGDGVQSAGSVVAVAGGYDVLGDHTYTDEGQYSATITIAAGQPLGSVVDQVDMLEALLPNGSRGTLHQRLVGELYRDLLGRQPDAVGLALWSERLDEGVPLADVVLSIESTVEYRADEVIGVYEKFLHRLPELAGLNFYTLQLLHGGTVEQLSAEIIASPEYIIARGGGTWHGFINSLFLDAVGRPIDATAEWNFTAWLIEGATPAQVASLVFSSAEYDAVLVDGFYERFLQRRADSSGMAVLAPAIASGETDEVIIARIIGDITGEYELRVAL